MPWGRLDDGLYDHPKLDALGRDRLPAIGLWTLAISWCNRRLTDGYVPRNRIRLLGGSISMADRLVDVGLFDRNGDDGYIVHDFLAFNDSAEQVEARRAQAADRQRKHRNVTGPVTRESQRDESVTNGVTGALVTAPTRAHAIARPGPSRPVPSDIPPNPPPSGGRRANGTNPRAKADAAATLAEGEKKAKAWRRNQRRIAYHAGLIDEGTYEAMNAEDTDLEKIPGWKERQAQMQAELEAAL